MPRDSLLRIARLTLSVAEAALPRYSHPKSPHTFTQAQLMACLVLRAALGTTYRGVTEVLEVSPPLIAALGLRRVPHYSTLQRFADRAATDEHIAALLAELLARVRAAGLAPGGSARIAGGSPVEVALDSTGLETTSASAHYRARSGKGQARYVKASVAVVCGALVCCGLVIDWGPNNDKRQAAALIARAEAATRAAGLPVARVLADAGYDAEWVHERIREGWGAETAIPPVIHRKDGTVGGRYRSQMQPVPAGYGRRWHVESFMSGLKRTTGSALRARSERALFAEAAVRVLAYSVRR